MKLSLIICMAPGHANNLVRVLNLLVQQKHRDWEVLILDDGSIDGEAVCSPFRSVYPLTYHWRENDCCPARSRNLGAKLAQYPGLVFIDADVLLNPFALAYYSTYLNQPGRHIYYGYYGREPRLAHSLWYSVHPAHWWDERYILDPQGWPELKEEVLHHPWHYAWSGNFGILKSTFESIQGFNEAFIGWGREDNEFALRASQADIQLNFTLDSWGEHLWHSIEDRFNRLSQSMAPVKDRLFGQFSPLKSFPPAHYYATDFQKQAMAKIIAEHYQVMGL